MSRNFSEDRLEKRLPNTINQLMRQDKQERTNQLTPEDWNNASYASGWSDLGLGYGGAQYYKDGSGRVYLRGISSKNSSTSQNDTIFTLPVGYRPEIIECFSIVQNDLWGQIRIHTDGRVTVWTGGTTAGNWYSFAGISFRTV